MSSFMSMNDSLMAPRVVSSTPNAGYGGGGGGIGMGTGGAGGSQQSSALLQQLLKQLSGQNKQANADSLSQYNNLLSTVKGTSDTVNGLYGKMNGLVDTQGQTALAQQGIKNQNNLGQAEQDLTSRGLGNTTIRTSALSGVNRDNSLATNAIQEGINANKIGLGMGQAQGQMQLGNMMGDAILSKQNQHPDMNMYLQLIQQLAASNIGAGRSGGGMSITG